MLARSFFIKSSSKLLVTRTGIKAWSSSILGRFRPLILELLALEWRKFHTFELEYLWSQLVNLDQILCVAALGWGKGCIRFWGRLDHSVERSLPFGLLIFLKWRLFKFTFFIMFLWLRCKHNCLFLYQSIWFYLMFYILLDFFSKAVGIQSDLLHYFKMIYMTYVNYGFIVAPPEPVEELICLQEGIL